MRVDGKFIIKSLVSFCFIEQWRSKLWQRERERERDKEVATSADRKWNRQINVARILQRERERERRVKSARHEIKWERVDRSVAGMYHFFPAGFRERKTNPTHTHTHLTIIHGPKSSYVAIPTLQTLHHCRPCCYSPFHTLPQLPQPVTRAYVWCYQTRSNL